MSYACPSILMHVVSSQHNACQRIGVTSHVSVGGCALSACLASAISESICICFLIDSPMSQYGHVDVRSHGDDDYVAVMDMVVMMIEYDNADDCNDAG